MSQSKTKQFQVQRLLADQIHALLHVLGLTPTNDSPLIGLSKPTETVSSKELEKLGLLDEPWPKAMSVLCAPITCVRALQALPDRTMVAVWYRGANSDEGTSVGYWPEDGMMQITAPCQVADHVAPATSALATHLVRDIRDPLQVDLSVPGLAAMAAAIDVVRADLFESMLRRAGQCSERFTIARLHDTYTTGRGELDARWLTSLLHLLMPVSVQIPEQVPEHALDELAELGLIERDSDHWRASAALLRLASYWKTPLPAIAHEVIAPDRYRYLIALRGDGPLFTLNFWRTQENSPGITLVSIKERDYQQALQGLMRSFYETTEPAPDVSEPVPVQKESIPSKDDSTDKGIRCDVCDHVKEQKGKFCSQCGAVFCSHCSRYVRKGSFCSICGKHL